MTPEAAAEHARIRAEKAPWIPAMLEQVVSDTYAQEDNQRSWVWQAWTYVVSPRVMEAVMGSQPQIRAVIGWISFSPEQVAAAGFWGEALELWYQQYYNLESSLGTEERTRMWAVMDLVLSGSVEIWGSEDV